MMRLSAVGIAIATILLPSLAMAQPSKPSCSYRESPGDRMHYDPFVIFFDSGSAAITRQAGKDLDNAARTYRPLAHCRLEVSAFADRVGPADYNLALSKRRAEAILVHLRRRGVRAEARIEAFGETRPLVETEDEVAEPQNRFATILIAPRDSP